jgi:ATP-dependent helicase/nuclease subunit A
MIKDQFERDRIENDLDTSFLVEAGAGSGKTRSMVQRMISLVKKQKANISQIAAITFTNKATSELKGRFVMALEEASSQTSNDEETAILKEAYENVNQCFIGTIHSFCGSLLRERPLEAGLDPTFTEIDEKQAREVQDQCWDEYLSNMMLAGETSEWNELASFGVDSETLRGVYHQMAENQDVAIFTKEVEYPNFDVIRETLLPLIEDAKVYFPTTPSEKGWDVCQKTMLDTLQLIKIKDFDDDLTVLQIVESFNKEMKVTLDRWTDKKMAKVYRDEIIPEWQERLLRPFLRSWREFIHPKIIHFVLPAVDYCQERKQELGLVDFQDLLLKTTKLLREHEEVRRYFRKRYTHLLVDEFQDTDPIQAEMMLLLTGKDSKQSDWKKQVPLEGSLFIVGDPKQSIYRFRRADISTYHFVKKKIEENGEVLKLTSNFRSVEAIGEFVDPIFKAKFLTDDHDTPVQATFAPMNTIQPNPGDLHDAYTINHPSVVRHNPELICEMDSEKIANFIAWACEGNLTIQDKDPSGQTINRKARPGDFLILLTRKKFLHVYAEKLEQYGILSDITGSSTSYEEMIALLQLVKCINDRQDQVALLAVLRGMLFGCSDEALYQYKKQYNFFSISDLSNEEDMLDEVKPVYDALKKLRQYGHWVSRLPALTAFMNIIEDIGLLPYSALQFSGLIRAGTLVQIIDQVQADPFASANWNDLTSLLMDLLKGEQDKGLEGNGLFVGSSQSVRIMNLHKAKGLEAPVVFLAAPYGEKVHTPTEHIDRMGKEPTGYFTFSKNHKVIAEPVGWAEKEEIENEYMKAEKDRLLYVAATRPKQILIISRYSSKPSISPWEDLCATLSLDRELIWEEKASVEKEILEEVPDISALLQPWNEWLEVSKQASIEKNNVTTIVKDESTFVLPRSKEGRGPVFGTVVHRCMEEIGKGRGQDDLPQLVSCLADGEGLDVKFQNEVISAVHGILASDIWKRGQNTKQRHHEFSFIFQKENQQLQGVIDFLFEEEDGWVIVDYKTDTFEEQNQQAFINHYQSQLQLYSKEWEETFHYKVKEKGLYFTMNHQYVVV